MILMIATSNANKNRALTNSLHSHWSSAVISYAVSESFVLLAECVFYSIIIIVLSQR